MRLTRPALVLAAAGVLVLSLTAHAAKPPVNWSDLEGDANGITLSYVVTGVPTDGGVKAAPSDNARDITKVTLANTWVKQGKKTVCTGFTATLTLKAPAVANTMYRIQGETETSPVFVIFEYDTADGSQDVRYSSSATQDDTIPLVKAVRATGNTITWTVTLKDISNIDEKVGSVMTALEGSAAMSVKGLLYLPIMDEAPAPEDSSFTFCK